LVTIRQMIAALVAAVETADDESRAVGVEDIKKY
jgi:hypothetical protein